MSQVWRKNELSPMGKAQRNHKYCKWNTNKKGIQEHIQRMDKKTQQPVAPKNTRETMRELQEKACQCPEQAQNVLG